MGYLTDRLIGCKDIVFRDIAVADPDAFCGEDEKSNLGWSHFFKKSTFEAEFFKQNLISRQMHTNKLTKI